MQIFANKLTGAYVVRETPIDEMADYNGKMMIIEMDKEGTITYTNRNFRETTGYTKEEIIGLPFDISRHPDMPDILCDQAFRTASDGKIWEGYIKSITKDGKYFWTSICMQPKLDLEKNLIGYILRKRGAEKEIINEIEDEYDRIKNSNPESFNSQFCGEMYRVPQ